MSNHEKKKPLMDTNKHESGETAKNTEVGFDSLVGLFEHTQTAMQTQAAKSVDIALVVRNWLFGWYIVEFENGGAERAELYGKKLLSNLAKELKTRGYKGLSTTNLKLCRAFYDQYSNIGQTLPDQSFLPLRNSETPSRKRELQSFLPDKIWQTLSAKFSLSWSHYVVLQTIDAEDERRFYELEAIQNAWGIRELKRQINSSLYERLALSRDKAGVKELAQKGQLVAKPSDVLKSPYVLEFLGLQERSEYSEHDLEAAIIDKIEHFLLELGKGFLFEARQKRFTFDDDHFYVDLVFYNRLLRCYVIIDLKRDRLTHQDLGQMQMYVNYFDRYVKLEDEKPTVGILLCHSKDDRLVELTLPKDANIHASSYQLYLPDKAALKKQLEDAQAEWEATHEDSSPVGEQGGNHE